MRVYSLLLAISLLWGFVASDTVISGRQDDAVPVETLSLDELYDLAVAEGGQLVVRAGGDEKNQQASTVQAFQERFPKINITLTVDLSKVTFLVVILGYEIMLFSVYSITTVSLTER